MGKLCRGLFDDARPSVLLALTQGSSTVCGPLPKIYGKGAAVFEQVVENFVEVVEICPQPRPTRWLLWDRGRYTVRYMVKKHKKPQMNWDTASATNTPSTPHR